MTVFIKESHHVTESVSTLNFSYESDRGCGFCFDCNADGSLTEETKALPAAMVNYEYALAESKKSDGLIVADGVVTKKYRSFVPAVIECSKCKKEHQLGSGSYADTQCSCGQNYNAFGQELRADYQDASTYAETGEDYYGDGDDY